MKHTFRAGFLFAGLGAGARGFMDAIGKLGSDSSAFLNLGGVDNDPLACQDFEYLTGAQALCADIAKLTPEELRKAWGTEAPDAIFMSPPCKGFSGLLPKKAANAPKYQALNRLVLQGMFLACETWASPPGLLVLENVPRITSRGAMLLTQVRELLSTYGYLFHEGFHDCGEIGGLAQHRRRYLMVARHPKTVPAFVYQPPSHKVRACGSVLEQLPLPEAESAGDLHRLPRLSWVNWVRLALIPAGGDWRDLPKAGEIQPGETAKNAGAFKGRPGFMGVQDWASPSPAVTGTMKVSGGHGTAAVADPRLSSPLKPGQKKREAWRRHHLNDWKEPAQTVTGDGGSSSFGIADPRLSHEPFRSSFGVDAWDKPAATVRGAANVRTATAAVADPRIPLGSENPGRHWNKYAVAGWEEPARTVTGGDARIGSGAPSVADPRVNARDGKRFTDQYRVTDWEQPARTVTGSTDIQEGAQSVADPRVVLNCQPRGNSRGPWGVLSWEEAAATVIGAARFNNGAFSIADPRKPPPFTPVIVANDGTWHRPLTTLELAALQDIPTRVDGKPLQLAGRSVARWRERIGNAVPGAAAKAIAQSLLKALLAAKLGTWFLSSDLVWVRGPKLRSTGTPPRGVPSPTRAGRSRFPPERSTP